MKTFFIALTLSALSFATETPPPASEWNNSAEATLLQTGGNTDVFTAGLNFESIFNPQPWRYVGKAGFLFNRDSGTTKAEKYTAELRAERKLVAGLSAFGDANYLRNTFGGFNSRYGLEAGVTYAFLDGPEHFFGTELGLGGIFENRTDGAGKDFVAATPGVEYRWKFSPTAELSDKVKSVFDLSQSANWRLNNTLSVTMALTSILSARVSFAVDFVNVPVTGKKKTDTATSFALVAKF